MNEDNNKDREVAKKLFGEVKKISADGGHIVNPEDLKKDFESPKSVVYCFCSGCGSLYELDQEEADVFAEETGAGKQQDFSGKYFEAKSCGACDSEEAAIELKSY